MLKIIVFIFLCTCLFPTLKAQLSPGSVTVYKKDTTFTCIAVDDAGSVYAGTNGKGLWKFDQKTWKNWSGFGTAFARGYLRQIATVGKDIWVASSGYVLFLGSGEAGNNVNYYGGMHKLYQGFPLKSTYYKGRSVLGQTNLFAQGPPTRNVLSAYIDKSGMPWCAASYHDSMTYPAFLNYNGRVHFAPGAVGRFNGTNFDFITGADLPDPTGILIGVGNNYKDENYSIGKRRTCRSVTQVGTEMWVSSDGYEKDASTIMTPGILRYKPDGTYIGKYDQNNTSMPFGSTSNDFGPSGLYEDANGRAWVTMNGNKGLAVMDSTGWHYVGVPPLLTSTNIFRPNAMNGNAAGEVFFGTAGSGLLVYKGAGAYSDASSYNLYTTVQGLSSNSIYSIAIAKDQTIWVATTAGVNKIQRGDLIVYNRKPFQTIITDVETFRRPVIQYDSKKPQEVLDKDTLLIAADGSKSTIFKWTGSSADKVKFKFVEDLTSIFKEEFGSFITEFQNIDSARVLFTHPQFVDEVYTLSDDGGHKVRMQVIDPTTSPATILLSVPVRFVLPPVLMVHGVWSSITSFDKMQAALLASSKNYKPYSLLRIWYAKADHPEPELSQFNYRYEVPNGIDKLLENCSLNKMSAGKADVLGHSRGGIFSRIYLQERYVTYRKDIHKLITLNTPHSGSQQGNLVLDKRSIFTKERISAPPFFVLRTKTLGEIAFGLVKDPPDDIRGAIELKVNASAIFEDLNGKGNLNRNTAYSHAIVGKQSFGTETLKNILINGITPGSATYNLRLQTALQSNGETLVDDFLKSIFNGEENDIVVPLSSQEGGLPPGSISRFPGLNVAHSNKKLGGVALAVGVLEITAVHVRVAELLRAKSTGNLFTTGGYKPAYLKDDYTFLKPNPSWLAGTAERVDVPQIDASITIDTTLHQRVYAAGDTAVIKISKSNSDTIIIGYTGSSIDVYSDVHFANDTMFKFPIPKDALGNILVEAYAFSNHQVAYDTATIVVGIPTGVQLDSIRVLKVEDKDIVTIPQGDSVAFILNGYYSDGIVRNITYQKPLTQTVLAGNISTAVPNKIKGLVIGFDQLIVSYQGNTDTINAEVVPLVTYPSAQILPVTFMGISATYKGDKIVVNWSTAQEINNSRFDVEYSSTGDHFATAGTIAATNNAYGGSYVYNHFNYVNGKNYYRIKQVDLDGKQSYSAVVSVLVSPQNNITVYPNPADEKLTINFSNQQNNIKSLRILNAAGQVLYNQKVIAGSLNTNVTVKGWIPGVYSIELINADDKKLVAKQFIKR